MMSRSPLCDIPSFVEIGLLVLEKKIFKGFTIYGHGGHIGHVTSIMFMNFHLHKHKSFHTKFGPNGSMISWFSQKSLGHFSQILPYVSF